MPKGRTHLEDSNAITDPHPPGATHGVSMYSPRGPDGVRLPISNAAFMAAEIAWQAARGCACRVAGVSKQYVTRAT